MNIFTFPECLDQLNKFYKLYDSSTIIVATDNHNNQLRSQDERVCRYCGLSYPKVFFNNDAHIISQLLGKNSLLCDYECDDCNATFSKYESAFVNWLGITRTLSGTKNRKNKVPEYVSNAGTVKANLYTVLNAEGTLISKQPDEKDAFKIDVETGTATITYLKRPYIPYNVYRVLLKIAFSALNEEEVADYAHVLQMLVHPKTNSELSKFAHIISTRLPMDQQALYPYGLLFKKRNPTAKIPLHFFIFYFANHVYSFPLPFSNQDFKNNCYSPLETVFPPPVFFEQPPANSMVTAKLEFMGSTEKVKDDQEMVGFQFNPADFANLTAFDPKSGEKQAYTFNPETIVSFFMVEQGKELKVPKKE